MKKICLAFSYSFHAIAQVSAVVAAAYQRDIRAFVCTQSPGGGKVLLMLPEGETGEHGGWGNMRGMPKVSGDGAEVFDWFLRRNKLSGAGIVSACTQLCRRAMWVNDGVRRDVSAIWVSEGMKQADVLAEDCAALITFAATDGTAPRNQNWLFAYINAFRQEGKPVLNLWRGEESDTANSEKESVVPSENMILPADGDMQRKRARRC